MLVRAFPVTCHLWFLPLVILSAAQAICASASESKSTCPGVPGKDPCTISFCRNASGNFLTCHLGFFLPLPITRTHLINGFVSGHDLSVSQSKARVAGERWLRSRAERP